MDRILQESVATYDPAVTVIVFVFLPSKSGQSMAMWRRKIAVPNNLRLAYVAEITQAMRALKKDYVCTVDECASCFIIAKEDTNQLMVYRLPGKEPETSIAPLPVVPPPPPGKTKRKWWKLGIDW